MDFHFINTTADTHKPSLDAESQGGAGAPLPSPQEAAVATAGSGRRASSLLSAQTVTTTTVTTTTVTTFPPLRIPQTQRKRALAPDRYPLADVPVPPALEHFAMDLNGQRMYFSQRDMDSGLSGPDILASISSNTIRSPEPLVPEPNRHAHTSHILGHAAGGAEAGIQRAMTPLYTQDDAQAVRRSAASASASASASIPPPLVLRSMGREGDRSNSRSRRSSSPHSPDTFRHFHRAAYSPPLPSQRALRLGGDSPEPSSPAIASATEAEAAVSSLATIGGDGDELVASPGAVLPLPSPLLSPRARPESMDTDDAGDIDISAGGSARRQLRFNEATGYASADDATECATPSSARRIDARQRVPREMAAMYDMPAIMATYDNLPPSMQTYLLHQLLRRTPRPALQFAAQTLLPVLHRDFIGELPSEAAHHVMRFMGVRELCRAACVSRRWRDAVNGDRAVWRARLVDARYAEPAPRIHPLCHTYFGLAPCEPPRAVAAPRPTRAELDLALLARRSALPAAALAASAAALLDAPGAGDCVRAESNGFKDAYARCYRLNRNWQTGACRRFNFVCDSGSVVTCIQLTHKYIVAGFDTKTIHVFDIATGAPVRRLVGHDGGVWALAVVGSTVVSGSTDRTVRVWDLETGRCSHVFAGHASTVRCLQILLPTD
ncbi:SCF ubiquitin ligase complex subunit cdc4, partial [Coemansia sp. RSA 1804]